jgi:putative membrane protein
MTAKSLISHLVATAFISTLIVTPSFAQSQPQPQTPANPRAGAPAGQEPARKDAMDKATSANADARFVMQAAEGGMLEVAKGKLAAQKGAHEGVKQFGQKMVDDHTKANEELKSLASSKNITLPADAPKGRAQAALSKLEKLDGAAFDRAYVDDQVRDHEKTIALFERQAKSGKDAELKAFAEKTLPTLKQHLTTVRDLKTQVAKGGTN